ELVIHGFGADARHGDLAFRILEIREIDVPRDLPVHADWLHALQEHLAGAFEHGAYVTTWALGFGLWALGLRSLWTQGFGLWALGFGYCTPEPRAQSPEPSDPSTPGQRRNPLSRA